MSSRALTRRQQDRHRESISVGKLIGRLQKFALGELQNKYGEPEEMTKEMIKASEILINKSLPNLQVTENIEVIDEPSLEQINQRIANLLASNPDLIEKLQQAKAEQDAKKRALPGNKE